MLVKLFPSSKGLSFIGVKTDSATLSFVANQLANANHISESELRGVVSLSNQDLAEISKILKGYKNCRYEALLNFKTVMNLLLTSRSEVGVKGLMKDGVVIDGVKTASQIEFIDDAGRLTLFLSGRVKPDAAETPGEDTPNGGYTGLTLTTHDGSTRANWQEMLTSERLARYDSSYKDVRVKLIQESLGYSDYMCLGRLLDGTLLFALNGGIQTSTFKCVICDSRSRLGHFLRAISGSDLGSEAQLLAAEILNDSLEVDFEVASHASKFASKLASMAEVGDSIAIMKGELRDACNALNTASVVASTLVENGEFSFGKVKEYLSHAKNLNTLYNQVEVKKLDSTSYSKIIASALRTPMMSEFGWIFAPSSERAPEKFRGVFSAQDDLLNIKESSSLEGSMESALAKIPTARKQALAEGMRKLALFNASYKDALSRYSKLVEARARNVTTIKVTNAAIKTFVDQLNALLGIEIRNWWSNSLIGPLSSFVTIKGGQAILNVEAIKRAVMKLNSTLNYKWEDCDYWVITRSANHESFYQGAPGVSTDRVKADWVYEGSGYAITIPQSTLKNLGVPFTMEAPVTATKQGYTSCGSFVTVVSPAVQQARPKVTEAEYSKITQVIQAYLDANQNLVTIYESTAVINEKLDKEISAAAFELGEIEKLKFESDELFAYAKALDANLKYIRANKESVATSNHISFSSTVIQSSENGGFDALVELPTSVALGIEKRLELHDEVLHPVTTSRFKKKSEVLSAIRSWVGNNGERYPNMVFNIDEDSCSVIIKHPKSEENPPKVAEITFRFVADEGDPLLASEDSVLQLEDFEDNSLKVRLTQVGIEFDAIATAKVTELDKSAITNFSQSDIKLYFDGREVFKTTVEKASSTNKKDKFVVIIGPYKIELSVKFEKIAINSSDGYKVTVAPTALEKTATTIKSLLFCGKDCSITQLTQLVYSLPIATRQTILEAIGQDNELSAGEVQNLLLSVEGLMNAGDDSKNHLENMMQLVLLSYGLTCVDCYAYIRNGAKLTFDELGEQLGAAYSHTQMNSILDYKEGKLW